MKNMFMAAAMLLLAGVSASAQSKAMDIYHNGKVVYSRFVSDIDSITFGTVASTFTANGTSFDMVTVAGGTFLMGAQSYSASEPNYNSEAYSDEQPVHAVTLSGFSIGKYEVTQGLWEVIMEKSLTSILDDHAWSNYGVGDSYPMYDVSWYDAITFCNKLSLLLGKTPVYCATKDGVGEVDFSTLTYSEIPAYNNATITWSAVTINSAADGFRLPTEAEWEYAARGGQKSNGYKYSGSNTLDDVACYYENAPLHHSMQPVGSKAPNELGLYDMSGNVFEWCNDWYDIDYYSSSSATTNPAGPSTGSIRMIRGGSWGSDTDHCRVADRNSEGRPDIRYYTLGFRLVLPY